MYILSCTTIFQVVIVYYFLQVMTGRRGIRVRGGRQGRGRHVPPSNSTTNNPTEDNLEEQELDDELVHEPQRQRGPNREP